MSERLVIRVERVLTAATDDAIVDGVVTVEDGRITAVGRADEFGAAAREHRMLLGTLVPGFVDSHAHPTLPSDRRPLRTQATALPETAALTAAAQLRRHLDSGYTTVLDCGAKGVTAFAVKSAAAAGLIAAPRLLAVGRPITPTRGHMSWCGSEADSPDEIRREVSILTSEGADAIKVIASGGGTGGIPTRPSYDSPSLVAAATAAHDQGLRVIAHCRATKAIERCALAQFDVIAHLEFLSPGLVVDMGGGAPTAFPHYDPRVGGVVARSDAYLDLNPHSSGWDTLLLLRDGAREGSLGESELAQLVALERYFDGMFHVVRELVGLGLADRMSFGSDAGPFDTEFGHPEYNLELARLGGLTPVQSLQAITRNAAPSIGCDEQVGTIEVGKRADLVLLPGDPLVDPGVAASPLLVLRAGSVVAGGLPA